MSEILSTVNIVAGAIMLIALIAMIIFVRKQEEFTLAKPLAFLMLLIVLGSAALIIRKNLSGADPETRRNEEMYYIRASAHVLAEHLAEIAPDRKALIITDPTTEGQTNIKLFIKQLRESLAPSVKVAAATSPDIPEFEKLRKTKSPADLPPFADYFKAEHINLLMKLYSDCELLIFMTGLPVDPDNMDIWKEDPESRPSVALAKCRSLKGLEQAIEEGMISAVLTRNPKPLYDGAPPPEDMKKAFDKRYLLVTTDNIRQISSKYPGLFPPTKK